VEVIDSGRRPRTQAGSKCTGERERSDDSHIGWAVRSKNVGASAIVIAIAGALYCLAPNNRAQLEALYGFGGLWFTGTDFLLTASITYIVILAFYYFTEHSPRISKSLRFLLVAAAFLASPVASSRRTLSHDERLAILSTMLKGFFAPMMVMSLMIFSTRALQNGAALITTEPWAEGLRATFDRYGFWFVLQIILFVDVLIFTLGYLVELPRLRNEIRSVDPTLLGWAAALLCYPPFNKLTGAILGSQVSDFPQFDSPTAHVVLNLALLSLMAVYASASVALGFKGSNLTHRGIISRGPYALVRHPAYTCKNLAWWIASIPLVSAALGQSTVIGIQAVASVIGWSMIYVLRALTEEDHLSSVDGDYAVYAAKVRYRFIPGIV
jgi:protein-S-isoprenylcysteine O-methyltransferase Ste14